MKAVPSESFVRWRLGRAHYRAGFALLALAFLLGIACERKESPRGVGDGKEPQRGVGDRKEPQRGVGDGKETLRAAGQDKASGGTAQTRAACMDLRDQLTQDYASYGVNLKPTCQDFVKPAGTSFSELAGHDGSEWALIREPLVIDPGAGYGLNKLRLEFGAPRSINSAFRSPAHNRQIGGARQSRHMFGDAADIRNVSRSLQEWQAMWAAAQKAGADFIEPRNGPCQLNCLHADWRNHRGGYRYGRQ
jgi:hypothetical protein